MTFSSARQVKTALVNVANQIFEEKSEEFVINPETSFQRVRKISFENTMLFPMLCTKGSLCSEILSFFPNEKLPSPSAICQRRSLIRPEAYREMFLRFSALIPVIKKYKGYRIIACDGTRLNLQYDPKNTDTFISNIPNRKGINQMHLVAFHDLLNSVYVDAVTQSGNDMDEYEAANIMIDRSDPETKDILIFDRGFDSINLFAHAIKHDKKFLVRVKESSAALKFIDPMVCNKDSFDVTLKISVGRKTAKTVRNICRHQNYQYIRADRRYDFICPGSDDVDEFTLRVVRVVIPSGESITMITNLPKQFSPEDIEFLYHLRWGIETSFKTLKYADELNYLHSLKNEFILQEIYAKLTLYNFSMAVANIADKLIKKGSQGLKYTYTININQAVNACILYLKQKIKDVLKIILHYKLPVKPDRKFDRHVTSQAARSLFYR